MGRRMVYIPSHEGARRVRVSRPGVMLAYDAVLVGGKLRMGSILGSSPPPPRLEVPLAFDPAAVDRQKKSMDLLRRRRGKRANIATSPAGVLLVSADLTVRRSLLGE
jgi:hypothetical protein